MKENLNTEELKEAAQGRYRRLQNVLERKADEMEELKTEMRARGSKRANCRPGTRKSTG